MLATTVSASEVLVAWVNAINSPANIGGWVFVLLYQLLGWFGPLLAGPLKVICIDIWTQYVTKDTTGLIQPFFAFYGVRSVQDLMLQAWQFLIGYPAGLVTFIPGLNAPDLSRNVINLLVKGSIDPNKCTTDPASCGITCARVPTLKVGGQNCATICAATPNNSLCF